MMMNHRLTFLDILVFVLSLYVLFILAIDTFVRFSPEVDKLLLYIDHGICIVFFIDFCKRFKEAESKLRFMRWGWIDLVTCIPAVGIFSESRTIRLIRLLRIIKAIKMTKFLLDFHFDTKKEGVAVSGFVITLIVIIFSSIAILQVETSPESNIKSLEDAIWWVFTTITTVGYGDRFPVTTEGRFIGVLLMLTGVGIFGMITAYVSSWFVTDSVIKVNKKDE